MVTMVFEPSRDSSKVILDDNEASGKRNEEKLVNPERQISLLGGTTFAMGCMIGSGIFVSPTGALERVGSVGMSLVMWLLGGVVSAVLGLVYGELGTLVPHSGGDYTYINKAWGSAPAFLAVWLTTIVNNTGSFPILSLVFADYLLAPIFGSCGAPVSLRKTVACIVIVTLAVTNVISVKFAVNTQIVFTFAKVTAHLIVSLGGIVYVAKGGVENIKTGFDGTSTNVLDYTEAFYKCMFAYSGFNRVNDIAEELINSKRNIPRAVLFSIICVTLIYATTNLSYCMLLSKKEIVSSSAVAYDWALKAIRPAAIIIPISVMCSTYGALNGGGFSNGRIMFAAARNGHYPEVMSYLHVRTAIPVMSVIATHIIGIILLIPGDIGPLINFKGFVQFVVIGLTITSLLRMRYNMPKKKEKSHSFRTPIPVLLFGLLVVIFMVISPFVVSPKIEFLYGLGFVVLGVIVYVPLIFMKRQVPGFDQVTTLFQLLLQSAPTSKIQAD